MYKGGYPIYRSKQVGIFCITNKIRVKIEKMNKKKKQQESIRCMGLFLFLVSFL